jgi:transcriptional regulator with XRE-family HTH domain
VELGERIATLREERALTQVELAEKAGISPSTLSLIESGKVPRPHVGTVRKIARALGIEPGDLRRAEGLAAPKAGRRSPSEPSLNDALAEERRARWEAAVEEARRLREGGRAQLAELLAAWQASRDRGELRSARRRYLDEIEALFNKAHGAAHGLADLLFAEGGIPAQDDWEEVRAADRFYWTLIEMMKNAGFVIQEHNSEPPTVEEPDAA